MALPSVREHGSDEDERGPADMRLHWEPVLEPGTDAGDPRSGAASMSEMKYRVSDTTLEAEWKKSNWIGSSHHYCSNCNYGEDGGYPPRGFKLGEFCPHCGAKMKNPQWISFEYDYD